MQWKQIDGVMTCWNLKANKPEEALRDHNSDPASKPYNVMPKTFDKIGMLLGWEQRLLQWQLAVN